MRRSTVTRREALKALAAAPLAATRVRPMAAQTPGRAELIVCGWDEVFILDVGRGATPASRKVWSWRASDSPEIPAALQRSFRTTDDCKPVDGGRRILISSSTGAIALVDRASRRAIFHAAVTNAHSIEMLPGGRIVAAASVSNNPGGNRLVMFDIATGVEIASDALTSAHGVVWDEARRTLWALGGEVLRGYDIGPSAQQPKLARTFELPLPSSSGHDLVPIPKSSRMFVSTVERCFYFDRDTRTLAPHDVMADWQDIKSYAVHPETGRIAYIQAEKPDWWAQHLHFRQPDGTLTLPGEHLYKARWNA